MRLKRAKILAGTFLTVLSILMLVIALFAFELHLDNNRILGARRAMLAWLGGLGLFISIVWAASPCLRRLTPGWRGSNTGQILSRAAALAPRGIDWLDRKLNRACTWKFFGLLRRNPIWWAGFGAALTILISFWYLTSGTLTTFFPSTSVFNLQANAFLAGQLALLETPPPELQALPNPYLFQNRSGLKEYLWDASFYNGKYYLYWGPVPALLASVVKSIRPKSIDDQYLLIFFISGLSISLASLLHWLRKTFYPNAPGWTVLLFTLAAGLSAPVFWLISSPSVYAAAIAGGQFFLMLGLLAALRGLDETDSSPFWMTAAGLAWGASIGCRLNNIIAIAWMVCLSGLFLLYQRKKRPHWFRQALFLLTPLLLCGAGLAWYNFARFGSIFETGHRYQLTGAALPADYSQVASLAYIPANLYNLLARPLNFRWDKFPFAFTPYIKDWMWPNFIRTPQPYFYSEPVVGVFMSIPIYWLVLLSLLRPLRAAWAWLNERQTGAAGLRHPLSSWVWAMVTGAVLSTLSTLMVFILTIMRYEADLVPMLTVLVALILWSALDFLSGHPWISRITLLLVLALGLASMLLGLLINFQNVDERFLLNNPELYQAIARLFMGKS